MKRTKKEKNTIANENKEANMSTTQIIIMRKRTKNKADNNIIKIIMIL